MSEPTRFSSLLEAMRDEPVFPSDFWGQDQPKCPHCGEECDISACDLYRLYEEGEHEVTCPHCNDEFVVRTRVSYSFYTDDQPSLAEQPQGKDSHER